MLFLFAASVPGINAIELSEICEYLQGLPYTSDVKFRAFLCIALKCVSGFPPLHFALC
jgi:hypothetical protein